MFDVVVIGSGPGGYVAAIKGAQLGGKIAIVEGGKLGGTCLNVGCIPTKALVHSATTYLLAKRARDFGVEIPDVRLNLEGVMAHKQKTIKTLVDGVERLLKGNGVSVYRGWAKVPSPGRVEVTMADGSKEVLETKHIIIATGSSQQLPPVSEESLAHTISSDDALELDHVPERLLVIGGGVLGVEFACIWNAFGAKVEMVKRSPLILPPIDEEISQRLMVILKRKGITVHSGIYVKEIREEGGEKVLVADTKDGGTKEFRADLVLVAMGRVPNFGGLDLDALGVAYDRHGIKTDDRMATNVPGIWAIGDVVGRTYLAPVASMEGIVAMENIFGKEARMDYSVIPSCVFSIPECASVGLKEKEAREKGLSVKVSKFPFSANGRAQAIGETDGLVKVVADATSGKILGMHILGPHADDLIHEGALAMKAGLTAKDVAEMVHAHPTLPEAVLEACHGAWDRPIHLLTGR
ncbi:MAG: dihydrolipoyl dehydrogenase [Candidatus Fermentithermobacillus carboniphilus]|uniref:Dihydrolipoyl dehydrogenase n=1 Tax=Candidatus Fermentithermobacillus carboniphilus TaxID=3085328 RepID=A0AAT9LEG0_9FIRM|nr:MAG: dihydrolipoyl dehydrogenase [Candidatus Fermentithermobacillus carboniphilus]